MKITVLTLGLSRLIESLKPGRMVECEYAPDSQAALYAPKPLKSGAAH